MKSHIQIVDNNGRCYNGINYYEKGGANMSYIILDQNGMWGKIKRLRNENI